MRVQLGRVIITQVPLVKVAKDFVKCARSFLSKNADVVLQVGVCVCVAVMLCSAAALVYNYTSCEVKDSWFLCSLITHTHQDLQHPILGKVLGDLEPTCVFLLTI